MRLVDHLCRNTGKGRLSARLIVWTGLRALAGLLIEQWASRADDVRQLWQACWTLPRQVGAELAGELNLVADAAVQVE